MVSTGIKGLGTTLNYGNAGGPTAGSTLGQVLDISGPNEEVTDIDITNMDSPDNRMEYIPGMIDPGEVTFEVIYTKAKAAALSGLIAVPKYWELTHPDGSKWAFDNSYIKSFGNEVPVNDAIKIPTTIKISGKPTFTASSG